MWFLYAPNVQKNGGIRPFLVAAYSVVFSMVLFMPLWPNGRQIAP
jgi:hypothetical protein